MATVTIKAGSLAGGLRRLERHIERAVVKSVEARVMDGLRATATDGELVVIEEIKTAQPYPLVASGDMLRGVGSTRAKRQVKVGVATPYASEMNRGMAPHDPGYMPLYEWARYKGYSEKEAVSVARGVRKKIQARGIAPRFYFTKAVQRIRHDVLPRRIKEALRSGRHPARF